MSGLIYLTVFLLKSATATPASAIAITAMYGIALKSSPVLTDESGVVDPLDVPGVPGVGLVVSDTGANVYSLKWSVVNVALPSFTVTSCVSTLPCLST